MSKISESPLSVEKSDRFSKCILYKKPTGKWSWASTCSLYGAPCSSVTTCVSICIPISRCHLGDKFEFQWRCKSRVSPAIPGPPSTRTNRKADFAAVVHVCFGWGGEGGLAFSACYRKAEPAYRRCPSGLSFHSTHFLTKRSSYFTSLFAHSSSFSTGSALLSQPPALAVRQLRFQAFTF